jgi:hypothetical protein
VDDLIPRVVFGRGFDYWEAGMDLHPSEDMYESFRKYQSSLLGQFDVLAQEYAFEVVDASADIRTVFDQLRDRIGRVLAGEPPEPIFDVRQPGAEAEESAVSGNARPIESASGETSAKAQAVAKAAEGDASR